MTMACTFPFNTTLASGSITSGKVECFGPPPPLVLHSPLSSVLLPIMPPSDILVMRIVVLARAYAGIEPGTAIVSHYVASNDVHAGPWAPLGYREMSMKTVDNKERACHFSFASICNNDAA